MRTVTATTGASAPHADDSLSLSAGTRRRLWWWLPIALAAVYGLALIAALPAIVAHTWWSADSDSAGYVALLYHHQAPGP